MSGSPDTPHTATATLFGLEMPGYERRPWTLGKPMPGPPPADPGVYVIEAWEDRDQRAYEEFRSQDGEPLSVFLDPADQAERAEFGILENRYVGQGISLKSRLDSYVGPTKRHVELRKLKLADLRGMKSEQRVGEWLVHWQSYTDVFAVLAQQFEETHKRSPRQREFYALLADVAAYEELSQRTITVGWITRVDVRPNSQDPDTLQSETLHSGFLRLAVEAALVYAGGRSSWGREHLVLNAADDAPVHVGESEIDDLPF